MIDEERSLVFTDIGKITESRFIESNELIRKNMKSIVENFIYIGDQLRSIKDRKIFKLLGYKNFVEYVKVEFGIGKNQAYNFIKISEKFNTDEYKEFGYSNLIEMLSLPKEELKKVTKDTTVKDIRSLKKSEKVEKEIKNEEIIEVVPVEVVPIEEQLTEFQIKFLDFFINSYFSKFTVDFQDKFNSSKKLKKTFGVDNIDIAFEMGKIHDFLKNKEV